MEPKHIFCQLFSKYKNKKFNFSKKKIKITKIYFNSTSFAISRTFKNVVVKTT